MLPIGFFTEIKTDKKIRAVAPGATAPFFCKCNRWKTSFQADTIFHNYYLKKQRRAVFGVNYTLKTALKWFSAGPILRGRSKPEKNIF